MVQIKLSVGDPSTLQTPTALMAIGEIFRIGEAGEVLRPPVVGTLRPRPTRSVRFPLGPGKYAFIFYVARGEGKFAITVSREDETSPFASRSDYDTEKQGFVGHSFIFEVA
jgi:hypothetical protein